MLQNFIQQISSEDQNKIIEEAATSLSNGINFNDIIDVDGLSIKASTAVRSRLDQRRITADHMMLSGLVDKVVSRVGGLEFFYPLFKRDDISEIALTPHGKLYIWLKGASDPELVQENVDRVAVNRAVEALLRPVGRSLSEATPDVDGKLPRTDKLAGLRGGARIKILHSVVVPGPYDLPSINIRLFEPSPVKPEKLISWNMAPATVIYGLLEIVSRTARMMIFGGTASGKTTFLSAMCNGIPKNKRVITIEDPQEIWIDHPHQVNIEARKAPHGSASVQDYSLRDGVDAAMRMSPKWLVVGEVRTGDAANALFRAQMSDHPGLSTFHADSPEALVRRMANIMFTDAGIRMEAAKDNFAMAIDIVVQVGFLNDKRACLGVWEVDRNLKGGDVQFIPLYQPGDTELKPFKRR